MSGLIRPSVALRGYSKCVGECAGEEHKEGFFSCRGGSRRVQKDLEQSSWGKGDVACFHLGSPSFNPDAFSTARTCEEQMSLLLSEKEVRREGTPDM